MSHSTAAHPTSIPIIRKHLDPARFARHYADTLDPNEALTRTLTPKPYSGIQLQSVPEKALIRLAEKTLNAPENQILITQALIQKVHETQITNAQYVLDQAREIYDKTTQKRKILDKEGNPYIDKFQPIAALRALELMGKHVDVQAFKETLKIESADDDLEHILNQARKRRENAQDADYTSTSTGTTHINTYEELLA